MVILRVRTITYQVFHKHLLGILTTLEINYYSSSLQVRKTPQRNQVNHLK